MSMVLRVGSVAGALFCLAGLGWVLAGNITIGMMNVGVGLVLVVLRKRKGSLR